MAARRTIALTYNDDFYLHRFKGGLLRALVAAGHTVYAVAPAGRAVEAIEDDGATFIHWPLSRRRASPVSEARSILALRSIYARTKPDLVHHFTAKPNIYGAMAARLAGVPVAVASVNGLGYVFIERDLRSTFIRPVVSLLYRLAFGMSGAVLFQNRDDVAFFQDRGLVSGRKVRHTAGGSGVNTSYFTPDAVGDDSLASLRGSLGLAEETPVVLMAGRMLAHKGVAEMVECARILSQRRQVCFLLAGAVDSGNPASISPDRLAEWEERGWVRYLGERSDIRELLALSDLVVLPSYREGFPRVLLEAAAMGKPMVATDVPGCRDVVDNGVNGLLVPARDAGALVIAIETLLDSPELRARMGKAAREKALREFDERDVVKGIMDVYDELLPGKPSA